LSRYFLGVDIGGTKSHSLIANENGQVVGFGQGGPGNYEVVGYSGVAGYDWPSERAPTIKAIHTLGLKAPFELVNDTVIGLLAGAAEGWGIAIVAGTSVNCWGWDCQRRVGRVTGNGTLMGEYGGGGELVMRAIHAVAAAWTRCGPPTALTQAFIEWYGASSEAELLEKLALQQYTFSADAAPLIFRIAQAGDAVAAECIRWAGQQLGRLVCGVIRQLEFESLAFEVVLVGSLYDGGPMLIEPLRQTIHELAPEAHLVRLTAPPVLGGVLLGMEQAGLDIRPVRSHLTRSVQQIAKYFTPDI
jgi:N-acetylglucosamine kinase-like BadF-type ATPase